jgi:hypothetical protein
MVMDYDGCRYFIDRIFLIKNVEERGRVKSKHVKSNRLRNKFSMTNKKSAVKLTTLFYLPPLFSYSLFLFIFALIIHNTINITGNSNAHNGYAVTF